MRPDGGAAEDGELSQTCRLDKWLWFARVVKSRTTAAGLIENGKARLNRSKVLKPSQGVRAGDVLTVAIGPRVRVLKVLALGVRRGPAQEARLLYEDLMPVTAGGGLDDTRPASVERTPGSGRPTKRDRRQMLRLKSQ